MSQQHSHDEHLICTACGTYYRNSPDRTHCSVCDDERQYVPASGQAFTTVTALKQKGHKVVFEEVSADIVALALEPKFAIGQRAYLVRTPQGNVLWDCIPFLDDDAIEKIKELGGVKAIGISHPHYYSAHPLYIKAFGCVVYAHVGDLSWIQNAGNTITPFTDSSFSPLPGITFIRCGGHFEGSSCLHLSRANNHNVLLTSDTIMVNADRKSFSFMYSYPNYVPLAPKEILGIWNAVREWQFEDVYGAFAGQSVIGDARKKVLWSARRYLRFEGWNVEEGDAESAEVGFRGPRQEYEM
ncbi:hypothetical protein PhCBS80983_g03895 [Powellomyces hirtus]|uniref:Metallo-beta-lactamase domain-containing protein n=1 Tax=Powellomyces hirtus TaxID=109895 RepID=A0A507DZU5_9FUNG|nr:hypothetical protein PhCBS80983_g03895 [Powellomyces hirtus]